METTVNNSLFALADQLEARLAQRVGKWTSSRPPLARAKIKVMVERILIKHGYAALPACFRSSLFAFFPPFLIALYRLPRSI